MKKYLGRLDLLLCLVLFLLSLATRWYYLPDNLFFGFEQGRDAIISRSIGHFQDFVLVGPKTDIDGVFHGAWYYYLMALPYAVGGGDPLIASGFLVVISSLVPVVMFWLFKSITGQRWWGMGAGLMTALSYEYISYARWLSNVTPAVLIITLVFACLWWYRQTRRDGWLVAALGLAGLAAQFQIILSLLLGGVFLVLWLSRWLPRPTVKSLVVAGLISGFLFAPMALFNLRNEFITLKSMQHYLAGATEQTESVPIGRSLIGYGEKMNRLVRNTFIPIKDWRQTTLVIVVVTAGFVVMTDAKRRSAGWLLIVWSLMSWPVIFFPRSLGLTQLYIGAGLGMIGLVTLALQRLWAFRWGKAVLLGWFLLFITGFGYMEYLLQSNQDVFFKTIQDDLNYKDQQAVLAYIHGDAAGQPYRLEAYTIPYFQPEAWRYLQQFWYPTDTAEGAQYVYIIVEEKVDLFWEKKWTEELGSSELMAEKQFGLIKVKKRKLL